MHTFDAPQLYLDLSRIAKPDIIETVEYETILARLKADAIARIEDLTLRERFTRALEVESSIPLIVLQTEAYAEVILRTRVNTAARAVMLAYSTGKDLENLAAWYGVERLIVTPATIDTPAIYEDDVRLRRRTQIAMESFSTAGAAGAYVYHALTAEPTIHDASAMKLGPGKVKVTIMNTEASPAPTTAQLTNVRNRLNENDVRPLTDDVSVSGPKIINTDIIAEIELYPGPDAGIVLGEATTELNNLLKINASLGMDLMRSSIISALRRPGVYNVNLIEPAIDLRVHFDGLVHVVNKKLTVSSVRSE